MNRYFIVLSYNGEPYHGWQIQPNAITVQEWINKALSTLLQEKINVVGCGRTDTGVHARHFVAHFDSRHADLNVRDHFVFKLNRFLPKTIAIFKIAKMPADAHARFDATARTYKYYINTAKNPFNHQLAYTYFYTFNVGAMNNAALRLKKHADFTSFSKVDTDTKTNICQITLAEWDENEHGLVFTITADRFLRNMVRAIVGTLLDIGLNKIPPKKIDEIIVAKDRKMAGTSAPAQGLFLEKIEYPYNI